MMKTVRPEGSTDHPRARPAGKPQCRDFTAPGPIPAGSRPGGTPPKRLSAASEMKIFKILVANESQLAKVSVVKLAEAKDLEIDSAMTLNQAMVGCDLQIQGVKGESCERLREMGFCEQLRVRKLAGGRNLLCSLCGTRVALSKDLAEQVLVRMAG